jgi:hypothetical protein
MAPARHPKNMHQDDEKYRQVMTLPTNFIYCRHCSLHRRIVLHTGEDRIERLCADYATHDALYLQCQQSDQHIQL